MRSNPYLSLLTLLSMLMAGSAFAEQASSDAKPEESPSPASNMESWEKDDRRQDWTWFGMGYESRRSFSDMKGAPNPGASPGSGGSGGAGGQGGPGGRR